MQANAQQTAINEQTVEQAGKLFDKLPMLGPIVWLLSQTPSHRHLFLSDLEWRILPPVSLGQCKLYMKGNAPLAFVSWAKVTDEVERRLSKGNVRLAPAEWANGDKIWLVDVIAPFGGVPELMKDLNENVFQEQEVNYLAADDSGTNLVVKHLG
jgi:cytolysin-activating lysine-acyltransferase